MDIKIEVGNIFRFIGYDDVSSIKKIYNLWEITSIFDPMCTVKRSYMQPFICEKYSISHFSDEDNWETCTEEDIERVKIDSIFFEGYYDYCKGIVNGKGI